MEIIQADLWSGKVCRACGNWWPLTDFHAHNKTPDGLAHQCRSCIHQTWREARSQQRPEHIRVPIFPRVRLESHKVPRIDPKNIRQRADTHKRRMQNPSGGDFTPEEWYDLCAKYNFRCLCCGIRKPLTIDHVIPISQGGSNHISNIQPLCAWCNGSKGVKIIDYRPTSCVES